MSEDAEFLEIRRGNLKLKRLRCLKCSRMFLTDRCHRICSGCKALAAWPPLGEVSFSDVDTGDLPEYMSPLAM